MQSSNLAKPREDSTKTLHDYLSNNYYKNLIALSLILMFAIVFYLIYLIIDSLLDKSYHHQKSLEAFERYESGSKRPRAPTSAAKLDDVETAKSKINERNAKIEFTSWSHRNLQVSFIHSVLCSAWLIRIIWFRNTEMFADLVAFISWDTYLLLAFSCGYFLYDLYDIYANGYFTKEWVVCVHHGIVLLTFGYHMVKLINIGYTTVALLMEFNSVFLHARKLLRFYSHKSDSALVRFNTAMNILTFVVFRFGVLGAIAFGVKRDGHRVTVNYLIMLITCTLAMAVINIVLFKRILVKDVINKLKLAKKSNSKANKFELSEKCLGVEGESLLLENDSSSKSGCNGDLSNNSKAATFLNTITGNHVSSEQAVGDNSHRNENMVIKKQD
jgi:hypothetical protein